MSEPKAWAIDISLVTDFLVGRRQNPGAAHRLPSASISRAGPRSSLSRDMGVRCCSLQG